MSIANVSLSDTFDLWRTRTNQLVNVINGLLEGQHTSSGAIKITNDTGLDGNASINVVNGHIRVGGNTFSSNTIEVVSNTATITIAGSGRLGTKVFLNMGDLSTSNTDTSVSNIASANLVNSVLSRAVSLFDVANTTAAAAFGQANNSNTTAGAAFGHANSVNITAGAAFTQANNANITAGAAFSHANSVNTTAAAAFSYANSVNITAGSAYSQANEANITAVAAFGQANSVNTTAVSAFAKANSVNTTAAAAFDKANSAFSPSTYVDGFIMTNNTTDANNYLNISRGVARDKNNSSFITLSANTTKHLNNTFFLGANAGGRFDATLANNIYHVFVISDGANVDIGFSQNSNPTSDSFYPSGYSYYRRVGYILRASNNIVGFNHTPENPETIWLNAIRLDYNVSDSNTSAITVTSAAPPNTKAILAATLIGTGSLWPVTTYAKIRPMTETDSVPSATDADLASSYLAVLMYTYYYAGIAPDSSQLTVLTNGSRQYKVRKTVPASTPTLSIGLLGWIDERKN